MTVADDLKAEYGFDYPARWDKIFDHLREKDMDAFVVTHPGNLRYLSCAHVPSFPLVNYIVLTSDGEIMAITSSLEMNRARKESAIEKLYIFSPYPGIEAYEEKADKALEKLLKELNAKNIMVDADKLPFEGFETKKDDFIFDMRKRKDRAEIEALKVATSIVKEADRELEERILKPGKTEIQVANELDYVIRDLGAQTNSFPTIIASGPNSAYSHHDCTTRVIKPGDVVICDFGAYYNGYASDMTRTYFVGDSGFDMELKHIYDLVLYGQKKAIDSLEKGKKFSEIDAVVRDFFKENNDMYRYFVHSLGHGIGVEIHEAPWLRPGSDDIIEVGNTFTIEPGIYIPDKGGIRIEDDFLITEDGYEILTRDRV